ncbi:MAG: cell division protein FtsA [Caldanaerobacter subterraneus]|nr:cell division protein FtsA [Caldanaerobacter subterraneus]
MNTNDIVFALDIGTRVVVGIVATENNGKLEILASEQMEHQERAMFDGQVHDIDKVANVILSIKEKLENTLKIKLREVAIAAAGRSLKTQFARAEKSIKEDHEITLEDIHSLELEALEIARKSIVSKSGITDYHTVGYSVSNYYLNGLPITNLKGHRGKEMAVEILATFLPFDVVEGLYASVKKSGLEVSYITLEPIAAINVSLKPDIRMLNIALVDIGAGTSDIAISKEGNIIAYSMVPYAGDEISEEIARHFLTDFATAEKIKKSTKKEIKFKDVLGIEHTISREEVLEVIKPSVKTLAQKICEEIVKYNGKSPSAVFLVGGSSNLPMLPEEIASFLKLPPNRVSVRDIKSVKILHSRPKKLKGPESITPIGIAYSAMINKRKDFVKVYVEDKLVKIFNIKSPTVMDALLAIDYSSQNLIPQSGKNLTFTLNGEKMTIKGEEGIPPKIYVNGTLANLKTSIKEGDRISIIGGKKGKDAFITVRDLVKGAENKEIYVNGKLADPDYSIKEGDEIRVEDSIKSFSITVNGKEVLLKGKREYMFIDLFNFIDIKLDNNRVPEMKINGKKASYTDLLHPGDVIEII